MGLRRGPFNRPGSGDLEVSCVQLWLWHPGSSWLMSLGFRARSCAVPWKGRLLGGSWVVISGVISPLLWVIAIVL